MKILILFILKILFFATLTHSTFIFNTPTKKVNSPTGNRFIVNIVQYEYVNNTRQPDQFKCLGILISSTHVIAPASCVKGEPGVHTGIQFTTTIDDNNSAGRSITYDKTRVFIHEDYKTTDNETNNIALIQFDPSIITTDPPLFSVFKPKKYGSIPSVADYCTIIGRDVHHSDSPVDDVFVISPHSCYGHGGKQAFCTIFNDNKGDVCKVIQGAPVICNNNEVSGFVLGESRSCMAANGKFQLRYHSIGDFSKWIVYYKDGPATTTAGPNSANSIKFSLSLFVVIFVYFLLQ